MFPGAECGTPVGRYASMYSSTFQCVRMPLVYLSITILCGCVCSGWDSCAAKMRQSYTLVDHTEHRRGSDHAGLTSRWPCSGWHPRHRSPDRASRSSEHGDSDSLCSAVVGWHAVHANVSHREALDGHFGRLPAPACHLPVDTVKDLHPIAYLPVSYASLVLKPAIRFTEDHSKR